MTTAGSFASDIQKLNKGGRSMLLRGQLRLHE